jgi:thiamine-phosphate pyrophosphorylase
MGPTQRWALADRRLYLCSPDRPDLEHFLDACIGAGVDIVQLREKRLPDGELVGRATLAQRVCALHGVPFVLNDRPDLAAAMGADGVHVGQHDASPSEARRTVGADAIVGLSTHATDELESAMGLPWRPRPPVHAADDRPRPTGAVAPVDYVSAGPVTATPTKPGRPGTGLGYIGEATSRAPWPVWVTGGVDPVTVVDMVAAGARHFVVVRWLTQASEPEAHALALRRAIDEAIDESIDRTGG